MLLHNLLVDNCTTQYHDFTAIANATFDLWSSRKFSKFSLAIIREGNHSFRKGYAYTNIEQQVQILGCAKQKCHDGEIVLSSRIVYVA